MLPKGVGPSTARVMLVGEAWNEHDERALEALVGPQGQELNRMLHEAGIMRSECYVTAVVNSRPKGNDPLIWFAEKKKDWTSAHREYMGKMVLPIVREGVESLWWEINQIRPHVIIALGNLPLWATTGAWGVLKWRGSQLRARAPEGCLGEGFHLPKVIPTIAPGLVMRQWEWRSAAVSDLKRAARERASLEYQNEPNWRFLIRPSFFQAASTLDRLLASLDAAPEEGIWIDFDLETRAGHIACAGLSWSLEEAICIPFMCVEDKYGYWSVDEEAALVHRLYRLLTHPRANIRGQNLLYDAQYTYRHWHFVPRVKQDTMISWHTMFAGLPKRLDYQASLLCNHYLWWKDEGRTWF